MPQDFYPFVDNTNPATPGNAAAVVRHPARIAVYDDAAAAPRVVVVEPKDVRSYLEEITLQVTQLAKDQGGTIPFMVIREIVENLIHAYFMEPTVSILEHGNTIRFSDQGPGIAEKDRALQYGTTSATEEMRRYIRGVGSGLPYAQQYMADKGGSLTIEDNIAGGTVVTLRAVAAPDVAAPASVPAQPAQGWSSAAQQPYYYPQPAYQQPMYPQPQPQPQPQPAYPTPGPAYYQPQAAPAYQQPAMQASPAPAVTVRGRAVLDYLREHDSVGPTELVGVYGESLPTWSRELQGLEAQGLIRKDGQKRRLTPMGVTFLGM